MNEIVAPPPYVPPPWPPLLGFSKKKVALEFDESDEGSLKKTLAAFHNPQSPFFAMPRDYAVGKPGIKALVIPGEALPTLRKWANQNGVNFLESEISPK